MSGRIIFSFFLEEEVMQDLSLVANFPCLFSLYNENSFKAPFK